MKDEKTGGKEKRKQRKKKAYDGGQKEGKKGAHQWRSSIINTVRYLLQ